MRAVYYPASGDDPIEFGQTQAHPYILRSIDGIESALASPITVKGPSQRGTTLIDSVVGERVIALGITLQAATPLAYQQARQALSAALTIEPRDSAGTPSFGVLRWYRDDGLEPVEWEAVPRESPQYGQARGPTYAEADLEFVCPGPYARAIADEYVLLKESGGGFSFPITHPFTMTSTNVDLEVTNRGSVRAPIIARLYGDVTVARLRNLTTGDYFEITGVIGAGDYVEVSTEYGNKYVDHVSGTTRTPAMERLNIAVSDLFSLRPGLNRLRYEANINVSGQATVFWRPRWSGV